MLTKAELIKKHLDQVHYIIDKGYKYLNDKDKDLVSHCQVRLIGGRDTSFHQQKWINDIIKKVENKLGDERYGK
ncbi:MAG: hypothetical protein WC516_06715 [Patescibacteria group bacterium]|jgi:hypothetical protein